MTLALSAALAVIAAASAPQMQARAQAHLVAQFERVGRQAPEQDKALTAAAQALATEALGTSADDVADLLSVASAVSAADGFDPTPRAIVVRATPPDHALDEFIGRKDLSQHPASHAGVGVAVSGRRAVVVALLADRKVQLARFPRRVERLGTTETLCGQLSSTLKRPELFVTRPTGSVDVVPLSAERGTRFCAAIPFREPGRHTVEVIGRGAGGPEVVAIFFVDAGKPAAGLSRERLAEPTTVAEARAALRTRINGLREAHGAPPLAADARLDAIAQQHSERMARDNFFAHVTPEGEDLRQRLTAAGYKYARAGENLGLAEGPLAAHFAIEHSPGHRRNLLEPEFTALGIGVVFETVEGRRQAIVTQVLARTVEQVADPLGAAYGAISARRKDRKLPSLSRSPVLEAIATEHARRALELDSPTVNLPGTRVHDRVFRAMGDVKRVAVDFYVSDDPRALPDSKSLDDPRNDRIGVGAVRGDSATYGAEKFWVVVIYADSQ